MSQNDFRSWYRRRLDFYTNFHHINTTDETYKREQLALQIDAALAWLSEFCCLHTSVTSFFVAASFAAPDTLWTNEYFWTYSSNNPDKTSLAGRSIGSRFHSAPPSFGLCICVWVFNRQRRFLKAIDSLVVSSRIGSTWPSALMTSLRSVLGQHNQPHTK